MNMSSWQTCSTPEEMLWEAHGFDRDRELRLFACACCRGIWPLLMRPEVRHAVETSELFADGLAPRTSLEEAVANVRPVLSQTEWLSGYAAAEAAGVNSWQAAQFTPLWAAEAQAESVARWCLRMTGKEYLAEQLAAAVWEQTRGHQCSLLREIFGDRLSQKSIDRRWGCWKDGRIVRLAQSIYDEGNFDQLPRLGELLQRAGCDDADILTHCRRRRVHVRGCWVLDLLLGNRNTTFETVRKPRSTHDSATDVRNGSPASLVLPVSRIIGASVDARFLGPAQSASIARVG
jgi:hypothetical protein